MTKDGVIYMRDVIGAGKRLILVLADNNMYASNSGTGKKFVWDDTHEMVAITPFSGDGSFIGARHYTVEFIEYGEIQCIMFEYTEDQHLMLLAKPTTGDTLP